MAFTTPVLFIVFNRPFETLKVLNVLKEIKPDKLFISCDGPRESNITDHHNVDKVRDLIFKNISWDCQIEYLFNEENLGCKVAVSNAISWFFTKVECGIILEDDCYPNLSFFSFCENMLLKYKNDENIWHISGNNSVDSFRFSGDDYLFSNFPFIWGWASWANKWKNYNVELGNIENDKFIEQVFRKKADINYWKKIFWQVKRGEIDTWDYQWTFICWYNSKLSIVPKFNLITNIGFSNSATHTKNYDPHLANLKQRNFLVKKYPSKIKNDIFFDWLIQKRFFNVSILFRIYNKLYRTLYFLVSSENTYIK